MSLAALTIMTISTLLGAVVCFRVPAVSVRARRVWALLFLILLTVAALLAILGSAGGRGVLSSPFEAALAMAAGTAAAALTGSSVTAAILQMSQRSGRRYRSPAHESEGELVQSKDPERDSSLHGGLWIGVLERTGVAVTLLAGWPTGLTILAAIKALGRFAELKNADAVERFILGTFASFLWAAAWSGVAMVLIRGV